MDLLDSRRMRELISTLAASYNLLVIHTPSIALAADVMALLTEASGVIVVGRLGKTPYRAIIELRRTLAHFAAQTIGVSSSTTTTGA